MSKRSKCTRRHSTRGPDQSYIGKNGNENGLCVCVVGRAIDVESFYIPENRAELRPDSQWTCHPRTQGRLIIRLALVVVTCARLSTHNVSACERTNFPIDRQKKL